MLSPQPTLKLFCQLNPTAFFPAGYVPTNTKIREPDYHLDNPSPGNASFQGFFMYLLIHPRHQYNTLNVCRILCWNTYFLCRPRKRNTFGLHYLTSFPECSLSIIPSCQVVDLCNVRCTITSWFLLSFSLVFSLVISSILLIRIFCTITYSVIFQYPFLAVPTLSITCFSFKLLIRAAIVFLLILSNSAKSP